MREELSVARSRGTITDGQRDARCGYSSSGMFFKQLQDEVSQVLHDGQSNEKCEKKGSRIRKSSS